MRVLYDHQIFIQQYFGGISRYFCQIMDQFSHDSQVDFRIALRYSQNDHLYQYPQLNRFWTGRNNYFSDSRSFAIFQRRIHINMLNHFFQNQQESIRQLKNQNFSVFHPTYYDPYFLPHLGKRPFVLTIYDMIHEQYPDTFKDNDPTSARKKVLADKAARIIAISHNTKADIIRFFGTDPEKIQVIHLAGSFDQENAPKKMHLPCNRILSERYLLFVGNRFSYKNFIFLIDSLSSLFKKDLSIHLVCAGGGGLSAFEKQRLRQLGLSSRVHQISVDDVTLGHLYRNAIAFIFPSLYEGFGIPILESFSCGCPAILANTSSLPEVGGDAAAYFNPDDQDSLTHIVETVINDEKQRLSMVQKGYVRAKAFSWETTADQTKRIYRMVSEQDF